MAKRTESTETALTTAPQSPEAIAADVFSQLIGDGFASIETVMLGDPTKGKQPLYVGKLIGPGEPIDMAPDPKTGEVKALPTWAFHPATKDEAGNITYADNVTHVIPASYMVQAGCARIYKQAALLQKEAIVGIAYVGKRETKRGLPLNEFRIFEKYE